MIAQLTGVEDKITKWFGGLPSLVLSALLVGIAAFALYMAFIEDHVLMKASAVAWLLLP